jgi:alkyldihydroxyacetonephosphate synthase
VLGESFETSVPWSQLTRVLPLTYRAVREAYKETQLPGKPILSVRMTQLYPTSCVLYMYMAPRDRSVLMAAGTFRIGTSREPPS